MCPLALVVVPVRTVLLPSSVFYSMPHLRFILRYWLRLVPRVALPTSSSLVLFAVCATSPTPSSRKFQCQVSLQVWATTTYSNDKGASTAPPSMPTRCWSLASSCHLHQQCILPCVRPQWCPSCIGCGECTSNRRRNLFQAVAQTVAP